MAGMVVLGAVQITTTVLEQELRVKAIMAAWEQLPQIMDVEAAGALAQ